MENISFVADHLRILVLNGRYSPGFVQGIDIVKNTTCHLVQYPERVRNSAGGLLRNHPTICGGYNLNTDSLTASCYQLDPSTNLWSFLSSLHTARIYHASVELDGGLWVTGGGHGSNDLSSTEMVHEDGSVVQGPPLPSARQAHCMVDLLDGRIMLIGGYGGRLNSNEVLFYHPSNRSFVRGPSLKKGRRYHACTVFQSHRHQLRYIVLVAGGYDNLRSVEVLDFSTPSAVWNESEFGLILIIISMSNLFIYFKHSFILMPESFHLVE